MGDEWVGKFDDLKDICEVIYLERTANISTTEIKKTLSNIDILELEKIESSLHDILELVKNISIK